MRFSFFIVVALLSVIDSLLLAKPNLLGKVGLLIFNTITLEHFQELCLRFRLSLLRPWFLANWLFI
jgi:hypothetical protein